MVCTSCKGSMMVADCEYYSDHVIRKRKCKSCGAVVFTREIISAESEKEFRRTKRFKDYARRQERKRRLNA